MMDDYELGSKLFGSRRAEAGRGASMSVMYGTAVSSSKGGEVLVVVDGETTSDGGAAIKFPTTEHIEEGDTVVITMSGGVAKSPLVSGTVGGGDRIYAKVGEFETVKAQEGLFNEVYSESVATSVIVADNADVQQIAAAKALVDQLNATTVTAELVAAPKAKFDEIIASGITAETVSADVIMVNRAELVEVSAEVAKFGTLNANNAAFSRIEAAEAAIADLDVDKLRANFATIDFANIDAANITVAKIRDIVARSGWFENVKITGDASITGQLKGVLIDGDTARFRNIYANALKLLGPDGLYYALNLAGLSASEAAELIAGSGELLEGGLHGSHIIAESVTATQIDVSSLVATMLLAKTVQVGGTEGIHSEQNGQRFSFLAPGYHLPEYQLTEDTSVVAGKIYYEYDQATDTYTEADTSGQGYNPAAHGLYEPYAFSASVPVPGEVAYIAVDQSTQESMFYMSRAVVVKDLRFGHWKWADRDNGNMALKWMGSAVMEAM